jgi:hypothetical protein
MPRRRTSSALHGKSSSHRRTKSAPTRRPIHEEPVHADDDPIFASKFPFAEIIPDWANFDPNTKNPAIGSSFASPHHGLSGARTVRDFTKFESACCLEWIDKEVDGVKYRVRCMNVFTVDSAQCTIHRKALYKDGPNAVYEKMKRGGGVLGGYQGSWMRWVEGRSAV